MGIVGLPYESIGDIPTARVLGNVAGATGQAQALTAEQLAALVGLPVDLTGYATEAYVDAAVEAIPAVDLSGYVPYTGATADLDLGAFGLSAFTGTFSGQIGLNGYAKIGGVSAGIAGVYAADGTTLGTLLVNQIGSVDHLNAVVFKAGGSWNSIRERQNRPVAFGFVDGYPAFQTSSGPLLVGYSGNGVHTPSGKGYGFGTAFNSADTWLKRVSAGVAGVYQTDGTTPGTLQAAKFNAQNGTTATEILAHKTYTSTTSLEYQRTGYDATSGLYDVGVDYVGTAGGTNRGKRIGSVNASGTFLGITVDPTGNITKTSDKRTYFGPTTYPSLLHGTTGVFFPGTGGGHWSFASRLAIGTSYTTAPVANQLYVKPSWSNAATTYQGMLIDITDSSSDVSSSIIEGRVGGSSLFSVSKSGGLLASTGTFSGEVNAASYTFASAPALLLRASGTSTVEAYRGGQAAALQATQNGGFILQGGWGSYKNQTANGNATGIDSPYSIALKPGASYDVQILNGTNAQQLSIYETYTSATSFGSLRVKANTGAAYQIGSSVGSAGGTNRNLELGHWNSAGTWTQYVVADSQNYTLSLYPNQTDRGLRLTSGTTSSKIESIATTLSIKGGSVIQLESTVWFSASIAQPTLAWDANQKNGGHLNIGTQNEPSSDKAPGGIKILAGRAKQTATTNINGASVYVVPGLGSTLGQDGSIHFNYDGTSVIGDSLFHAKATLADSTASTASLNIPSGVAPTTPADGDIWCVGDVLYRRIAGVTKSVTFS